MKKNGQKGFMLIEALIVSVFVGVTLVVLFIQLQNVSSSYTRTFSYNTAGNLYNARTLKRYLATRNFDGFLGDLKSTVKGYINITSCTNPNYTLAGETATITQEYCQTLYKALNIKQVLLTFEDLTDVKHIITKNAEEDNISQKMVDFISYIQYDKNPSKYRLIIEFNNDTYASIQLSQSAFANAVTSALKGEVPSNRWTSAPVIPLSVSLEPDIGGAITYTWQIKSGDTWIRATECANASTCDASREGINTYRVIINNSLYGDVISNHYIVKKDTTIPTCTITVTGTTNASGIYTSDAKLTLNISDTLSGVNTYGLTTNGTETYNNIKDVTQGNTTGITYYGYVKDKVGNTNKCSKTVVVDKTASTILAQKINVISKDVYMYVSEHRNISQIATISPTNATVQKLKVTSSNTNNVSVSNDEIVCGLVPSMTSVALETTDGSKLKEQVNIYCAQ